MLGRFEVRQVAAALDHGHQIDGETAEIVAEMRSQGQYQGIPMPLEALEVRNTVSGDLAYPKATRPIFDRFFPSSVAARLGVNSISILQGSVEYPVATQGAVAGWAATEGGDVPNATAYQTTETMLSPDHTLGAHMRGNRPLWAALQNQAAAVSGVWAVLGVQFHGSSSSRRLLM